MMDPPWTCREYGPISDALYGEDGRFHCSGIDCDLVVSILTDDEKEQVKQPRKNFTKSVFATKRKSTRSGTTRHDMEILARINERERRIKGGDGMKKTKKTKKVTKKTKKTTAQKNKDRTGACCQCCNVLWLLKVNPPTCPSCHRKANSPKRGKSKRKKNDPIALEINALEVCFRAIDGLDGGIRLRVVDYIGLRYGRAKFAVPQNE